MPRIYGVYQVPPSPGTPLCCALYVAFRVSDAAGTASFWRPSVLCVSFLARQVPPASGAPLCSMLPVVTFVRSRYHQFLVPLCALCFFSCAVGTTILWRPSVLYADFLAHQVPASGAPLCSEFLFWRGRYHQPLAPLCALCCFSCAAGTTGLCRAHRVSRLFAPHQQELNAGNGPSARILLLFLKVGLTNK